MFVWVGLGRRKEEGEGEGTRVWDEDEEEERERVARKGKRKPSLKCNYRGGGAREFFTPPDLETVFIRHVERTS